MIKIDFPDPTVYTETLSRHSPYFQAFLGPISSESNSRVVELNLPCPDALEPTLFHLSTGEAPDFFAGQERGSVSPALFFGLLANVTYLLLDALTEQCMAFLISRIRAGDHEGKT